jgi:uncharacterized membrane protein
VKARVDPRARRWLTGVTLAAAVFCTFVVLVPVAEREGCRGASVARLALRPACHQIPERCLDLGAGPLAVCARCAGLYAGGLAGLLFTLLSNRRHKPTLRWVVVAAIPSAIDFLVGIIGLPGLANWPRFFLAVVPGIMLGLLLADAVAQLAGGNGRPAANRVE